MASQAMFFDRPARARKICRDHDVRGRPSHQGDPMHRNQANVTFQSSKGISDA
jgi:hypothetical protein